MEQKTLIRKKKFIIKPLLLGFLILIFLGVFTEGWTSTNINWKRSFYTPNLSGTTISNSQGGFLLCFPENVDSQISSYRLVKTDDMGITLWSKTYSKVEWSYSIASIAPTYDNGFVLCGEASSEFVEKVLYICKIDSNGTEEWHKIYGSSRGNCIGSDIVARTDQDPFSGGYYAIGRSGLLSEDYPTIYMVRLFEDGGAFWNKELEINTTIWAEAVCYHNYHIIIAGTCDTESESMEAIWVSKLNHLGNIVWEKKIDGPDRESASDIEVTSSGAFVVVGSTKSLGEGDNSFIAIKLDSEGREVWRRIYETFTDSECNSIVATSDGGYLLVGTSGSNIMVIKTDSRGSEVWRKIFGGLYSREEGYWGFESIPGCYVVGGFSSLFSKFPSIVLFELNEGGLPTGNIFFWLGWIVKLTFIITILRFIFNIYTNAHAFRA